MKWLKIYIIVFVALWSNHAAAYVNPADTSFVQNEFKKLDYDKTTKKLVPKVYKVKRTEPFRLPQIPSIITYVVMMVIGIIALGGVLMSIRSNPSVQTKPADATHSIEDISEVDLQKILKEALAASDYRLAFRVRFLMILQDMQNNGMIRWNKYKTNRHYIAELPSDLKTNFRRMAMIFDRVWYGEQELDEATYQQLSVHFDSFKLRRPVK